MKIYLEKAGIDVKNLTTELSNKNGAQPNVYYLHGDHLGTANFVTEQHGDATQFFINLPFGETMAEQMTGIYDNPYKFNAKELDSETGLYYYGARYYNPRLSIWYGVDPKANSYPQWSPYNYTFDNPIIYTDPDGMDPLPAHMRTAAIRIAAAGLNSIGGGKVKGNSGAEKLMNGLMISYAAKNNMTLGEMADMQNEIGQFYSGLALVKGWHKDDYNKLYTNIINNMNASHAVIDQVTRGSIKEAENNWGILGMAGEVATVIAAEGLFPVNAGKITPRGPKMTNIDILDMGQRINGGARFPLENGPKNGILYRFNNQQGIGNYAVYDSEGMILKRVDLTGPDHGGVPTPHAIEYGRNTLPNGQIRVQSPSTKASPRPARNYEIPRKK